MPAVHLKRWQSNWAVRDRLNCILPARPHRAHGRACSLPAPPSSGYPLKEAAEPAGLRTGLAAGNASCRMVGRVGGRVRRGLPGHRKRPWAVSGELVAGKRRGRRAVYIWQRTHAAGRVLAQNHWTRAAGSAIDHPGGARCACPRLRLCPAPAIASASCLRSGARLVFLAKPLRDTDPLPPDVVLSLEFLPAIWAERLGEARAARFADSLNFCGSSGSSGSNFSDFSGALQAHEVTREERRNADDNDEERWR